MLTRPGMRQAPPMSISRAPEGTCAQAAGPTHEILLPSVMTAMPRCGSMCSLPSSSVTFRSA